MTRSPSTRTLSLLLAALLAAGALAGCATDDGDNGGTTTTPGGTTPTGTTPGSGTDRESSTELYGITSGGTGGVYFPIANGIAAAVGNDSDIQFTMEVSSSDGSVQNARRLASGDHEWALMQNDIAAEAIAGTGAFAADGPIEEITGVASLYLELVQIVTLKSANIMTLDDLNGKRVVLGAPGSGAAANAERVLEAAGVNAETQHLELQQAAEQLRDGNVDAVFWTGGVPTGAIVSLSTTTDVRIVPIDGADAEALREAYPSFAEATLPAGTYGGQDEAVPTVGVAAVLVVRSDVPEDDVYLLTKMLFENGDVQNSHAQARNIQLESALNGMDEIPLHPGARAYYEDNDVELPS